MKTVHLALLVTGSLACDFLPREGELAEPATGTRQRPIASDISTWTYAFDAPWRLEPALVNGRNEYGAIPIQLTVHNGNLVTDSDDPAPGRFDWVKVKLLRGDMAGVITERLYRFQDLTEVEFTAPFWARTTSGPTPAPPSRNLCQPVRDVTCGARGPARPDFESIGGTSEWHANVWFDIPANEAVAGETLLLEIEMQTLFGDVPFSLKNWVRVHLGEAPLPRFSPSWGYIDLHYHSQGTDNDGESAYSYRGVLRAMGAMGLDYVVASEHASNSGQVIDIDLSEQRTVELSGRDVEVLRDMSPERWRFNLDVLYGPGGANRAVLDDPSGRRPQNVRGYGLAPQIILGGEVDVIPEIAGDDVTLGIGYGYGRRYPWWDADGRWEREEQGRRLLEPTAAGTYFVKDAQGGAAGGLISPDYNFARQHLVYIPASVREDGFVASNTGPYGGATRSLGNVLDEVGSKGYAFLAHPLSGDAPGSISGPDLIPYSRYQLDLAWRSRAVLGLQFWNEDTRLETNIHEDSMWEMSDGMGSGDGDAREVTAEALFPYHTFNPYFSDLFRTAALLFPFPFTNQPQRWARSLPHPDIDRVLFNGAFVWDEYLRKGLSLRETAALAWLPQGEPRRWFMGGGSDAHGDLNYRREGYMVSTTKVVDTAIGKPRNLVYLGPSPKTRKGDAVVHSTAQVAAGLASGNFSVTDGPAVRIAIDRNQNSVVDGDDTPMGGVAHAHMDEDLPVLVEWRSTPEFGPVARIDLYLGVDGQAGGRTYAPENPGVPRHPNDRTIMEVIGPSGVLTRGYWLDPTGQLRLSIDPDGRAAGAGYCGSRLVRIRLRDFPKDWNGQPGSRFYVRAVAVTRPALVNPLQLEGVCNSAEDTAFKQSGGCIQRYAFTNPVWAITHRRPTTWSGDTKAGLAASEIEASAKRVCIPDKLGRPNCSPVR